MSILKIVKLLISVTETAPYIHVHTAVHIHTHIHSNRPRSQILKAQWHCSPKDIPSADNGHSMEKKSG